MAKMAGDATMMSHKKGSVPDKIVTPISTVYYRKRGETSEKFWNRANEEYRKHIRSLYTPKMHKFRKGYASSIIAFPLLDMNGNSVLYAINNGRNYKFPRLVEYVKLKVRLVRE